MTPDELSKHGLRVKPLEWKVLPHSLSTINECAVAVASFSQGYQAQRDPWAASYMVNLHPNLPIMDTTMWWESKGHATIEAAKAAAQADYTARICAALEHIPHIQAPDDHAPADPAIIKQSQTDVLPLPPPPKATE